MATSVRVFPKSDLTAAERLIPADAGRTRSARLPTSRTYLKIIRDNVLTFINAVLFGLAAALIALGRTSDALVSVGVVAVNMAVGLVQEIHAKRVLDRIAVLTRPQATVIRDGVQQQIDPAEVSVGDLLLACTGDQIVADGTVIGDRSADVDEALLTGESGRIPKRKGDHVFAGTFCAGGTLEYVAEQVGADSTADRIATTARAFRRVLTPLQHEINRVVRVSLVLVIVFEMLIALANAFDHTSLVDSVRIAVVIAGLIPNGLFLAIAVAYAMGAVRIAGKEALVQQANAVESLSHVDVLCLDKTGTLTTTGFQLAKTLAVQGTQSEFRARLGAYAASSSDSNRTLAALRTALPASPLPVVSEVLFSSARKWSALTLAEPNGPASYVLGAADTLEPHLREAESLPQEAEEWASSGLRVLLLTCAPVHWQPAADTEASIPEGLEPLGLVALLDQLRPDAARIVAEFAATGVQVRLLSGDDPHTVGAVARQAGLAPGGVVSGSELAELTPEQLSQTVLSGAICGRLSPDQKERTIRALRASGHYVAMIGDGVNDVPALKAADLAVAMQSGTAAARAVADITLLHDNFAALPFALEEGQRIRGGMHAILKLFLTRVLYMATLILMLAIIDAGFPFAPKQNALVTLLTVGLPTLALAAWARPLEPREDSSSVFQFVIPSACALAVMGLSVYMGYLILGPLVGGQSPLDAFNTRTAQPLAQTAITTASILCGLLLIVFVQPKGGLEWKHIVLTAALAVGLVLILADARLRSLFELKSLTPIDYLVLTLVVAIWAFLVRSIWRWQLLDRLLGPASPAAQHFEPKPSDTRAV